MVRYDGAPVTPETLAPMAAAMSFWGPDGHGQWCGEGVGLGHLMLHVTSESLHERLPASIRVAPHLVITADARIDNRGELFEALGVPSPGRATTPDSSLILLAYERWGADCVRRLLGDFAFAIWDARERRLFCARDPFGCMPFVYHCDGKHFILASDIKGVLARMEPPRLNEPMIAAYLHMSTYYAEKRLTFFEEVVKLPPAHTLIVTATGVQLSKYWSPEDAPEVRLATDADYAEQMRILFQESVECRLRSAFPIGSHLSGGLDSSSVSAAAARSLRSRGWKLEVFSWSPPPEPGQASGTDTEYARIEAVCRAESLSCHYLPVTEENYFELFQRDFTREPTEMMAREGNVQSRAAELGLRVMLSGWGGDEAVSARTNGLSEFFSRGQWDEFRAVAAFRRKAADSRATWKLLRRARTLGGIVRDIFTPHLPDSLYTLCFNDVWLKNWADCAEPSFARIHRSAVLALRGPAFRPQQGIRATICHLLEYGHIAKRTEHWAASGARQQLAYRYPLLDRRLVEFALGIPEIQHCRTETRLPIFRRSVSELMPAACDWDRRKTEASTLGALKKTWFCAHEEWARRLMSNPTSVRFVDPEMIRKAILGISRRDKIAALSGVREAFACYPLGKLAPFKE
jgi:asparagine synthase (glutamine-hydrolysing)